MSPEDRERVAALFADPTSPLVEEIAGEMRAGRRFGDPATRPAAQPADLSIARELLQAERERLGRRHFSDPSDADKVCPGCARLGAIIAELKLLG